MRAFERFKTKEKERESGFSGQSVSADVSFLLKKSTCAQERKIPQRPKRAGGTQDQMLNQKHDTRSVIPGSLQTTE